MGWQIIVLSALFASGVVNAAVALVCRDWSEAVAWIVVGLLTVARLAEIRR